MAVEAGINGRTVPPNAAFDSFYLGGTEILLRSYKIDGVNNVGYAFDKRASTQIYDLI
jgi:hypothetical protein